ncbi:MAG: hypothetical protein JXA30_05650 [Deltaproteobacteria bacterium]|nr:hypothetical protein [Deltaproteobacteria bacterium]
MVDCVAVTGAASGVGRACTELLLKEGYRVLACVHILLITHDLGVVNELADRVVVMYAAKLAEQGLRREVLANAKHPYTQGLLRSMPAQARRGQRLQAIEGTVPPITEWPKGCRFSTRCPHAFEPCPDQVPRLSMHSQTHRVWCHLYP